ACDYFFFRAEDGIRDRNVTGVQTCALPISFEYKLDGARIQVHKARDEVRVFSRQLNDVTQAVPEVVETVRRLPLDDAILDGEARSEERRVGKEGESVGCEEG